MQRAVDWLYPKQDKIAVFIMACLPLVLLGVEPGLREVVVSGWVSVLQDGPLMGGIVAATLAIGFLAALTFPFVPHDLRGPATIVLGINALALLIGNSLSAFQSGPGLQRWVGIAFVAYFGGWVLAIKHRTREQLIEARDPQPLEALFAAALCTVLLAGGVLAGMGWFTAYSLAVAIAPGVHIAIRRRVLDLGQIQEER